MEGDNLPFQSVPPMPPVEPVTPVAPISPAPANNPKSNLPFLIFGVAGLLIGVVGIFLFLSGNRKTTAPIELLPATVMPGDDNTVPITVNNSVGSSDAGNADFVTKETLCYTLLLPKNNDAGAENDCNLEFTAFDAASNYDSLKGGVMISTEDKEFAGAEAMAQSWYDNYVGEKPVIVSEGATLVGGVPGYQIRSSGGPTEQVDTFVYLPGKYTAHGYPVTGFHILKGLGAAGDDRDSRLAELARLFNTWQWK